MNKYSAAVSATALLVAVSACAPQITASHAEIIQAHSQQIVAMSPAQFQAKLPGATLKDAHTVTRTLVVFDRDSANTSCNVGQIEEHQLQSQDAAAYGAFWLPDHVHVSVLAYPHVAGDTWMREIITDDGYTGYTCKDYLSETD